MGAVVLGLTGGVCTGKSVVARFLREEGPTVIEADEIARSLWRRGQEAYRMVVEAFGEGILRDGGEVDRRKLGRLVFSDPSK
ncbi:MAG: dephospho-CoA kinase, partial [Deltaproteobacteria bacterium]